jgi:hypothetical protein
MEFDGMCVKEEVQMSIDGLEAEEQQCSCRCARQKQARLARPS